QLRFRSHDHPEEELGFFRLLDTATYWMPKVFLGNTFICLTIIRSDACPAADQLIDEPIIRRSAGNHFRESNDSLSENSRSLQQIKWVQFVRSVNRPVIQHHRFLARYLIPANLRPRKRPIRLDLGAWIV